MADGNDAGAQASASEKTIADLRAENDDLRRQVAALTAEIEAHRAEGADSGGHVPEGTPQEIMLDDFYTGRLNASCHIDI
jgi:phage I-like protein